MHRVHRVYRLEGTTELPGTVLAFYIRCFQAENSECHKKNDRRVGKCCIYFSLPLQLSGAKWRPTKKNKYKRRPDNLPPKFVNLALLRLPMIAFPPSEVI